jgi:hypothetical protein
MKITKQQLQKVIQEELAAELTEAEMRGSLKQMSKWKDMILQDAGDEQLLNNIGKQLRARTPNVQAEFIVDIVQAFGLTPDQAVLRNALIKGEQAEKSAGAAIDPFDAPVRKQTFGKGTGGGFDADDLARFGTSKNPNA